jgi:hypothetical protein
VATAVVTLPAAAQPVILTPPPDEPRGQVVAPTVREEPAPANEARLRILVVGDFMADTLVNGLEQMLSGSDIAVIDGASGPSGLVRDDFLDWNEELPRLLDQRSPDAVVVMLGANDRQPLTTSSGTYGVRSTAWLTQYEARLGRLGETLRAYGRPVVWVGLPPMRSTALSTDLAFFNTLYEEKADAIAATFIDTWEIFAGPDGRYAREGPDVAGEVRTLRAEDGVNLNRAGQAKLAYFVEAALQPSLRLEMARLPAALAPLERAVEVPAGADAGGVGPVLSLTDPAPGAGAALASSPPALTPGTALYNLVVEGTPPPPVAGRVDDFRWPADLPPETARP